MSARSGNTEGATGEERSRVPGLLWAVKLLPMLFQFPSLLGHEVVQQIHRRNRFQRVHAFLQAEQLVAQRFFFLIYFSSYSWRCCYPSLISVLRSRTIAANMSVLDLPVCVKRSLKRAANTKQHFSLCNSFLP